MKTPTEKKKLALRKATLRVLDRSDLRAAGGGVYGPTADCALATVTRICGEVG